jgi:tryptophanyl-tRNA synthetase
VKDSKRLLTGYRPTGRMHLGHYEGNLKNMLAAQDEQECFFFIADWHALTTKYKDVSALKTDTREMVIDWLAMGLDPAKCSIYRQSDIPEIAEFNLYLSMITPLGWLERNTTYKDQLRELGARLVATYGFLGYPVLQAADILIMHSDLVPVGEDQLPHLELAREIARRFNHYYGNYLKEPQAVLSPSPKVLGLDGRKMSKSYDNAIFLSDEPEAIAKKVKMMVTDPARIRANDPGHPEVCSVFASREIFNSRETEELSKACRAGEIGCAACKARLTEVITDMLGPFRARRAELVKTPEIVDETLAAGLAKAKPIAEATLKNCRGRLNID